MRKSEVQTFKPSGAAALRSWPCPCCFVSGGLCIRLDRGGGRPRPGRRRRGWGWGSKEEGSRFSVAAECSSQLSNWMLFRVAIGPMRKNFVCRIVLFGPLTCDPPCRQPRPQKYNSSHTWGKQAWKLYHRLASSSGLALDDPVGELEGAGGSWVKKHLVPVVALIIVSRDSLGTRVRLTSSLTLAR